MKQVAFIRDNGEIAHIVSPGTDDMYTSGARYGDLTAIDLAHDEDGSQYIITKYWKDGQWETRAPRPGFYYKWESYDWVLDQEQLYQIIINDRNSRLYFSDWTQLPDSPLSETKKEEWRVYRQELRDLTNNLTGITNLDQVPWPVPPT